MKERPALLVKFLPLELSKLGQCVIKSTTPLQDPFHYLNYFILGSTNLLHPITLAQGDSAVLEGLEIDCNTERSPQLIIARIALPDTSGSSNTSILTPHDLMYYS